MYKEELFGRIVTSTLDIPSFARVFGVSKLYMHVTCVDFDILLC